MICARCGNEFTGRKRKYCTKDCCLRAHGHDPDYKPEPSCLSCGKVLTEGQKKYCSGACRSMAYYIRKHPNRMPQVERWKAEHEQAINKNQRTCKHCGKGFVMVRHSLGIYCSHKCYGEARSERARKELKPKVKKIWHCKVCGKKLDDYRVYCGDECRKKEARNKYYEDHDRNLERAKSRYIQVERNRRLGSRANKPLVCGYCGEPFIPQYNSGHRLYCSSTCSKRSERWASHLSDGALRRDRAERHGERFKAVDIYERDRWICGICHSKVNRKIKYPHPMSASLDHIIPLAKGGTHTRDNVQLAHLVCNSKTGAGGVKQLRLFG